MSKKTTKMKFSVDMFYGNPDVPLYMPGQVYDVEKHMVSRWLKRGGQIVEDAEEQQPVAEEAAPGEKTEDGAAKHPDHQPVKSKGRHFHKR